MHLEIPVRSNIGVKYDEGNLSLSPKELLETDWNLYEEFVFWEYEDSPLRITEAPEVICEFIQMMNDNTKAKMLWAVHLQKGVTKWISNEPEKAICHHYYILVSLPHNKNVGDWQSFMMKGCNVWFPTPDSVKRIDLPQGKEELEKIDQIIGRIPDDNSGIYIKPSRK